MLSDWKHLRTNYLTTQSALVAGLLLLLLAFLAVMWSSIAECYIGRRLLGLSDKNQTLTFLGIGMGGGKIEPSIGLPCLQCRSKACHITSYARRHLEKKPPRQTGIRRVLSREWLGSSAVVLLLVSTSLPDLAGT